MSAGYIFFFVADSIILSRSFVSAIIHMVLFLELAKLAQVKKDKDYLYLMLLAFLQILAASSLTIDISFVITLGLFLVALVSTLMSFDIVRSQRTERVYTGPDIDRSLGGMSVWATAWIVVVGMALFFSIPRIGTGYFSRAAEQALLISGFTETVELGEIGEIKQSSALVMRTRVVDGTASALPKWRGIALDTFDGARWSKTRRRRRQAVRTSPNTYIVDVRPSNLGGAGTGDDVRFEVFLEPLATNTLFGPHSMLEVEGSFRGGLELDPFGSVYQRAPPSRRIQYEVASRMPARNVVDSEADPGEALVDSERPLQLPENLDPEIVALAESITSGGTTVVEKASLVESHLKREYAYSLDLSWDPGESPLSTFLFEVRAGHCEYFASSMAIMLRSVGIPTRIVNGFLAGEYNSIGRSYIIRQSDAHSWVEVYIPGRGWIDFDPTPPDPNRQEMSLTRLIAHYFDAADLFWNSYVLTYDTDSQFQLFRSAQDMAQTLQQRLSRTSDRWIVSSEAISDSLSARIRGVVESFRFWAGLLAVGLLLLAFQNRHTINVYWKIWKLNRGHGNADVDVVSELFYRAASVAGRRTPKRSPHETWREWIGRLPDEGRRGLIRTALGIFEKARYGSRPITPDEYSHLEETVQQLKKA
jgi:transglutaminase-like putative cysteine protease